MHRHICQILLSAPPQIGTWPSSRALYGLDVMLSLPDDAASMCKTLHNARSSTARMVSGTTLHLNREQQRPQGQGQQQQPRQALQGSGTLPAITSQLQGIRLSASNADVGSAEASQSDQAGKLGGTAAAAAPCSTLQTAAAAGASSRHSSEVVADANDVTKGSVSSKYTSIPEPVAAAASSNHAPKGHKQLRKAQLQLLEVNSSPDFSLVGKQWPNFLDDAFSVLFLPHQKIPASFVAVS
jgi:hypothetical protein